MKYKTLKALVKAYKSGKLTAPLVIDNNYCCVYVGDKCVYKERTYKLYENALTALGIPWNNPCGRKRNE